MNEITKKRFIRLISFSALASLGIAAIYLIYHFTGLGFKCPLFEITHLKCSGCGNTHALQSLLNLDFAKSFSYNYIYPIEFLYIGRVYLNSSKNYIKNGKFNYKPSHQLIDILVLIIIILWIPVRNILGV